MTLSRPQTTRWVSHTTTVRPVAPSPRRARRSPRLAVLHANHFRKDWQRRVRTWFDQPGRKLRRRNARVAKAAALGVRPLAKLRPAVRAPTVRYSRKVREGRGFTLGELKEAGVSRKAARGLGIVVDHRRRNLSEEGKAVNVERLKAYQARLIVFPRKAGKPKKGDSTGDDLTAATTRAAVPLPAVYKPEGPRKITEEEKEFEAFRTLREERGKARYEGKRKVAAAKVRVCSSPLVPPTDARYRRTRRMRRRRSRCLLAAVCYPALSGSFCMFPPMYSSKHLWKSHDGVMHYDSHASGQASI
jgi:large subunit ribosomal protein L13e